MLLSKSEINYLKLLILFSGTEGMAVKLTANYFRLSQKTDWSLNHYHVEIIQKDSSDPLETRLKKRLVRLIEGFNSFFYLFDGGSFFTNRTLPQVQNFLKIYSIKKNHLLDY